jgi:L-fucose mutarotase/ribose pyranase (RbsD/FucU family)
MLKTISPLISPDLLKVLAEMGHGDEIIFSDAHFPAHSMGPQVIAPTACGSAICCRRLFRCLS